MKKILIIIISSLITTKAFSQDSSIFSRIDSVVKVSERTTSTIYQKIGKNPIEVIDGKSPDKILNVYRFTDKGVLVSTTFSAYAIEDTDIIVNLYYDSVGNLIKAITASFDMNNHRSTYTYYYSHDQLLNKEMETAGVHKANYYVDLANRIRRNLKRKPIRFPGN